MYKIIITFITYCITFSSFGQIGIGTINPHPSAILDVESTTKAFLPPRMTANERELIVDPAVGLITYCTDCCESGSLLYFNGTNWESLIDCSTIDFDLDGVINSLDLDNDNDGILDSNENEFFFNNKFGAEGFGADEGWDYSGSLNSVLFNPFFQAIFFNSGNNPTDGRVSQTHNLIASSSGILTFTILSSSNTTPSFDVEINNVLFNTYSVTTSDQNINVAVQSNLNGELKIEFVDRTINDNNNNILSLKNISFKADSLDENLNQIINSLDLDSDGDGCFDALEGGLTTLTINDIYLNGAIKGGVDLNGVPLKASGGQSQKASNISSICD